MEVDEDEESILRRTVVNLTHVVNVNRQDLITPQLTQAIEHIPIVSLNEHQPLYTYNMLPQIVAEAAVPYQYVPIDPEPGPSHVENDIIIVENSEPINLVDEDTNSPSDSPNDVNNEIEEEKQNNNVPEERSTRKRSLDETVDEDGSLCPICLDYWSNTGDHRICCLKCGHLFGLKCVKRWFSTQTKKTCPTCKKKANKNDIRCLYVKKLTAVDRSEVEEMKQQLEALIQEKNRLQTDLAKVSCREHLNNQEIAQLKAQIANLTRNNQLNPPNSNTIQSRYDFVKLYMDKSMELCKNSECRVFDTNSKLDLLIASMKSPNLFNDYGLRKIIMSNYRQTAFIPIHTKQIRDVCFHNINNLILTVSMDKTFKITDNICNTITHQFTHQMPLWSCKWDINNEYNFYVGSQSGNVLMYDLRNLTESIKTLSVNGDGSPVVSIESLPSGPGELLPNGGVISCKLLSLWLFENNYCNNLLKSHLLPFDGPFVSMKYNLINKQLLLSTRPNDNVPHARHILCTLDSDNDKINCNPIHIFKGGGMQKLLSKSCFLTNNTNDYIAAHQENLKSVYLWSINNGKKVASIPAHDAVLDLKGVQNQNGDFLVSLTEKKLEFFKFI